MSQHNINEINARLYRTWQFLVTQHQIFHVAPFTGIEIYSAMYISSEAFMGLNLWPFEDGTSEYALNLTENVFEFIKEEDMY